MRSHEERQAADDRHWETKLAVEAAQDRLEWCGFLAIVAVAIVAFSALVFSL